jgi:hypothetical protein
MPSFEPEDVHRHHGLPRHGVPVVDHGQVALGDDHARLVDWLVCKIGPHVPPRSAHSRSFW